MHGKTKRIASKANRGGYYKSSKLKKAGVFLLILSMVVCLLPNTGYALSEDSTSQTKYEDINEFQEARWQQIQSEVFVDSNGAAVTDGYTPEETATALDNGTISVKAGNGYFNWVDNDELAARGVEAWDGSTEVVTPETNTVTYDYTSDYTYYDSSQQQEVTGNHGSTVTYYVYNVGTASEFAYVMQTLIGSTYKNRQINILVNLTNDINLNGAEQIWDPITYGVNGWIYIEGNGHTIYNMRAQDTYYVGLFGDLVSALVVKNLNFQSSMLIATSQNASGYSYVGTLYGRSTLYYTSASSAPTSIYVYNVHAQEGYVHSEGSYAAGLTGGTGRASFLMRDCSTSDYDIYAAAHVGGLCSYTAKISSTYTESVNVKYNVDFPDVPESCSDGSYPIMIEDCYSTDCELFSVSTNAHSGAFISCGDHYVIRSCFTNNTMYGNVSTGAFVGAVNTSTNTSSGYYDDGYNRTVTCYLENCYASGIVEGESYIGGFTGRKQWSTVYNAGKSVVFRNCYSTAMVGNDYAGSYIGGFIGADAPADTVITINVDGVLETFTGTAYINCYAAGETGNILTNTEDNSESDYIGGFIGQFYMDYYSYSSAWNAWTETGLYNCYYDKQTTAMRERGIGNVDRLDTTGLESVLTGVYTQASLVKGVQGLAYSSDSDVIAAGLNVYMDSEKESSSTWTYTDGYYPELSVFADTSTSSFGYIEEVSTSDDKEHRSTAIKDWYVTYDSDGNEVQTTRSLDMAATAENYSEASVSTVYLDHWDTIMDISTGAVAEEYEWVCGLPQNKMTYNDSTGCWEISYENVAADTYEFKVQEGTSWSYNYGSDGFNGSNCVLTLAEVSDVTISFAYSGSILTDGGSSTEYTITATITPVSGSGAQTVTLGTSAISGDVSYVLAGTTALTGYNWETDGTTAADRVLTSNGDGTYSLTITGVAGGTNYGYTVVPSGYDKASGTNRFFYLLGSSDLAAGGGTGCDSYTLVFTFDPSDGSTEVAVYDSNDASQGTDLSASCLESTPRTSSDESDSLIHFFSIAGDEELTGYNWYGTDEDTDEYVASAVSAGTMLYDDATGLWTKTYYNVPVGTDGESYSRSFKVVANGSWDYGIDYGNNGQNYVIQLNGDSADVSSCNVTITFNPSNGEIGVSTSPAGCLVEEDESGFSWYIAGEYELVSNDAYTSDVTVYDTVRDITSAFSFTASSTVDWAVNDNRNAVEDVISLFNGGSAMEISYSVEGQDVTGSFTGEVLAITGETDTSAGITVYSVEGFMPGKSWVQVTQGEGTSLNGTLGTRNIRLIPTVYLESGTDASVEVSYNAVTGDADNAVTVGTTESRGTQIFGSSLEFTYYNPALGAAYAITDKVGLGIYNNYVKQGSSSALQAYDSTALRDADESSAHVAGTYFAMYSAFGESASYDDGCSMSETYTDTLSVDLLSSQALVGSSYDSGSGGGQTIVKVYKVSTASDGTKTYSKIYTDSDAGSTSAYHANYLKWTGQTGFTYSDAGEYLVTFYWLLSDGRYLSDSKTVTVSVTTGDLVVSKEATGDAADPAREYSFTVELSEKISGTYGGVTFDKGKASFTLKSGEGVTAKGLPEGITYTVTEEKESGDTSTTTVRNQDGTSAEGVIATGIITGGGTAVAAYTNNYVTEEPQTQEPATEEPQTQEPGTEESESEAVESESTETETPESEESESKESESEIPETEESENGETEFTETENGESESDEGGESETEESWGNETENEEPETGEPEAGGDTGSKAGTVRTGDADLPKLWAVMCAGLLCMLICMGKRGTKS